MNHCDRCGAKTKPGEFLCAACYNYFCPQWDAEERERWEKRIGRLRELEIQVASLKEDMQRLGPEAQLQSRNAGMQRVIEMAMKAAPSEAIVFVEKAAPVNRCLPVPFTIGAQGPPSP